MSEPDELFTLRTLFWLGNYQAAINEANGLNRIPPTLVKEKEEYLYRSYIGLRQNHIILSEIKDSPNTPIGHLAIKLLAKYMEDSSTKDIAILQLKEWLSDFSVLNNKTLQTIAATIFIQDDKISEAFKVIKNGSNLEQHAMIVTLCLKIDRLDLAQKELKLMKSIDEDSVLTMLAGAWINLNLNVSKPQEAGYVYEELIDKYGGSFALMNGLAISKMQQHLFEEAESTLLEALATSPADPDTLANLIVVSYQLQKPVEVSNRYLSQLKAKSPNHTLLQSLNNFQNAFDRVSSTLA